MKLIAILNNKGGVGKTTSTVNLAFAVSQTMKKVLIVDLDPSASASYHLGFDKSKKSFSTLCDFLINMDNSIRNYIHKYTDNLDILPSEVLLSDFCQELQDDEGDKLFIKREHLSLGYDYIFFDCPPNTGSLTLNILTISDYVLIPVQVQYTALSGLYITLDLVNKVKRHLNDKLKILGLFATYFDKRIKVSTDVLEQLKYELDGMVFNSTIGINSKIIEAYNKQKTVIEYSPKAKGSLDYKELALEFLKKINNG